MRTAGDATVSKSHHRRRPPNAAHGLLIAALAVTLALALSTGAPASGAQTAASASSAAATEVVALRAKANNRYVAAENAGNSSLIANRTAIGPWETFDLIHVNSTDVYLRAHANGKYVCAESAGAGALISNRTAAGPWETFQLISNSDGTKSLRARANNKLVTAESAGGAALIANRTAIGPWEKFDVVKVNAANQSPAPTPTEWPGPTNTGVPSGTTLTTYTGSLNITTANTVIDAKTINGTLNIRASGVQVRRSMINGTVGIDDNSNYSVTITDSTINAGNREGTGLGEVNFTAIRVQISGGNRSANCWRNCRIEDSYVYGQFRDSSGRAHESGIRMGANGVIRHNTIWCSAPEVPPDAGCSANLTGYGDFATVHDMTIDNNLFKASASSGFCAYGGSSPGKPYPNAYNIVFTNNVFERGSNGKCGVYGPITAFDSNASGNGWSGNVWDNGGTVLASN